MILWPVETAVACTSVWTLFFFRLATLMSEAVSRHTFADRVMTI